MSDQRTIQFSVEFVTTATNFKKIVNDLQSELAKIKPGTQIYDSLSDQLNRIKKLAEQTSAAVEKGTVPGSATRDTNNLVRNFELLDSLIKKFQGGFGSVDFKDLNLAHVDFAPKVQELQQLQTELQKTVAELERLKGLTVGQALQGQALVPGLSEVADRSALDYYQELIQILDTLKQKQEDLQRQELSKSQSLALSKTSVQQSQGALDYYGVMKGLTGNSKMSLSKAFSGANFGRFVEAAYDQNAPNQNYQQILQMMGFDQATIEMAKQEAIANAQRMKTDVDQAIKDMYASMGAQTQRHLADGSGAFTTKVLKGNVNRAQQDQASLNEIRANLSQTATSINNLTAQKDQLAPVVGGANIQDLSTRVTTLTQQVQDLRNQILSIQRNSNSGGKGGGSTPYPTEDPNAALMDEKIKQQQQLGASVDMMARRWIGAYAIINKVTRTIRQAWNDIKSLDKTMTSIAVVTSMSVQDLWGQLNEYMDIAQQYGATTQGVYEVSQIYYQQGLSTNDVMAATTETLKMARIAGMDYAEAADAMTVAIRSFKMEMTDASTVTDVYSKVAASSASSSEELAIAMSKTASGAENVGSSFENTTAMLAVMIETTRESAQNLGSALKSIISRYGEMKIGKTEDEEGELIDYNRVDTALKSVGISIKDAQGQFRDFDEVIFELSEKWDTLDKNTQRYIATIMAGNRQQSRFIALVDNWERLDELSGIANNAEDAGLLQYSKTLDSFDAKLNKIKNSFQSFYMNLFNSEGFKGILDVVNDILEGFSKLGTAGLAFLPGLVAGVRAVFSIIKLTIQSTLSEAFAYSRLQGELAWEYIFGRFKQEKEEGTQFSKNEDEKQAQYSKQKAQETEQAKLTEKAERLSQGQVMHKTAVEQEKAMVVQGVNDQNAFTQAKMAETNTKKIVGCRSVQGVMTATAKLEDIKRAVHERKTSQQTNQLKTMEHTTTEVTNTDTTGVQADVREKIENENEVESSNFAVQEHQRMEDTKRAITTTGASQRGALNRAADTSLSGVGVDVALHNAKNKQSGKRAAASMGLSLAGSALTIVGAQQTGAGNTELGAGLAAGGNVLAYAGMGMMFGGVGGIIGALLGLALSAGDLVKAFSKNTKLQEALSKATENAEKAAVKRAETKEKATNLESGIKELETLEERKDYSEEDYQAWAEANDALIEKYPELFGYMDSYGNRIVNLDRASESLESSLLDAALAAKESFSAEQKKKQVELNKVKYGEHIVDINNTSLLEGWGKSVMDVNPISSALLMGPARPLIQHFYGKELEDKTALGLLGQAYVFDEIGLKLQSLGFNDNGTGGMEITNYEMLQLMNDKNLSLEKLLSNNENLSDDEQFIYDVLLRGKFINEKNGVLTVDEDFQSLVQNYEELNLLEQQAFSKQVASQNILINSLKSEVDNSIQELDGYNAIVLRMAGGIRQASALELSDYNELISDFAFFYENLSNAKKEAFNSIFGNLDNYSLKELKEELSGFGLKEKDPIYKAYIKEWEEVMLNQQARLFNIVFPESTDIFTFYDWAEKYGNEDTPLEEQKEQYKDYIKQIIRQKSENDLKDDELFNLLFDSDTDMVKLSSEEIDLWIDFFTSQQDIIDESTSVFAREAAESRKDILGEMFAKMATIDFSAEGWEKQLSEYSGNFEIDFTDWTKEDILSFQRLLIAENAGSVEWQEQLDELVGTYGESIDWTKEELSNLLYTNLNTRLTLLEEDIISFIEELEDLSDKQTKGFTWEESQKLLKQLGTNQSWEEIFRINEEGLIVLNDFDKTVADLYSKKEEDFDKLTSSIKIADGNREVHDILIKGYEQYYTDGELSDTDKKEWKESLTELGLSVELSEYLIDSIINNSDMTIQEYDKLLTELAAQNSYLAKYFKDSRERVQADLSYDLYFKENYDSAGKVKELASSTLSLESIKEAAKATGALSSYRNESGGIDWEAFFNNFSGIKIDEYGEVIITNADAYAESLINLLGITDQTLINNIYEQVFGQYYTQWQERQDDLKTFFKDYQFTDKEIIEMYAQAVAKGTADSEIGYKAYAETVLGMTKNDEDLWEVQDIETYYKMITYKAIDNPDLDFDDITPWHEWAAQRAQALLERREKSIDFLKEFTKDASPEQLEEAVELGLLSYEEISDSDLEAFKAGEKTVYDLIAAQKPEVFADPELKKAWEYGQAKAAIETAEWLRELIEKTALSPEELLEIWELIGSPDEAFETWVRNNEDAFKWDAISGTYRIGAGAYDIYAKAAAEKGATEMPTPLEFLKTLHAGQKEQQEAVTSVLSSLTPEATIQDLDAALEAKLITEAQYFQAIADAASGDKTYYESIIGAVNRSNKEYDDLIQELEVSELSSRRADAESLFRDAKLEEETIQKMWKDASLVGEEANLSMYDWAEKYLGATYKNGEWIITNAAQAWQTMVGWYKQEYGEEDYQKYMPIKEETEFRAMWANYQDTQDQAIIDFLEGISPESQEDILSEAVELGIATWTEINTWKQKGYDAYSTMRAIVKEKGNTKWQDTLEKSYKTYYQETFNEVESLFSDGLFTEEELEGMWLADTDFTGSFDSWIGQFTQGKDAFFEKVGDGWVIKSEKAYEEMIQWIADTFGPEFVAALPSYKKLSAMGILEGERREEEQIDFIGGLDFDNITTDDLTKAAELGLISQENLYWAIQNNIDYSIIMLEALKSVNGDAAKALANAKAANFDDKISEIQGLVEDYSWTTEELTNIIGNTDWIKGEAFEFNIETGEWEAASEGALNTLREFIKAKYGQAYADMLPTWTELEKIKAFDKVKKSNERLDLINSITEDFSLDNLESLVEAEMLSYEQALKIWQLHGKERWETLSKEIVLQTQEEVNAFEAAVTQMQFSEAEAAADLFTDGTFSLSEIVDLWSQLYASDLIEGAEKDLNSWVNSLKLNYTDGEFKITTEEGYKNLVAAAEKIYGDAWKGLIPSADEIIAANLLEEKTSKEDTLSFLESLDYGEIIASNIQEAMEKGLLSAEQVRWGLEQGLSYQELIRLGASQSEEAVAAFNLGLYNYQQNQREQALTLLEDNLFSEEEILTMWEATRKDNEDIFSWLTRNEINWTEEGYKFVDSAIGLETLAKYTDSFGLGISAADLSEWWLKGITQIETDVKQAETEDFLSKLTKDAGYAEAEKAVELGILTREQLVYALAQGEESYWDIIIAYANENKDNTKALQTTIANSRMENIKKIESLLEDNSFTSEELISIWEKTEQELDFGSWTAAAGFIYEDGEWKADTEAAWEAIRSYISEEFGAETSAAYSEYINVLAKNLIDELKASHALQLKVKQDDINSFIEGLTLDADLDVIQEAIELGIITAKDWEDAGSPTTSKEILNLIGGKLTSEESRLFNKTISQLNAERMAEINEVLADRLFSATEIYEAWEASGDGGNWTDWAANEGFILQADGSFKAADKKAYKAMVKYVGEKFGPAYEALLPTYDDWVSLGALEDGAETISKQDFLKNLSVEASFDDLQSAADLLGFRFTEEQIQKVLNGSMTAYELILEEMSKSGLYSQLVPYYQALAKDEAIKSISFGEKITTPEDYSKTKKALETLVSEEAETILKDGIIDLEETIKILKTSDRYKEGISLLAVAESYGIALNKFFEMSVESPAEVLKYLELEISDLTPEQYDAYVSAYQNYRDSIARLFSGTGKAEDAERMVKALNSAELKTKGENEERYDWSYSDFIITAEGIQLDRKKFFEALALLKQTDYQLYTSLRETLVTSPELLGESFNSITDVLKAIDDLSNSVTDSILEQNKALQEQASIYGEIYAKMSMTHSDGWDFLNQDLHGNAQNFTDWAGAVNSAFQQINSGEGIEPTQFLNMLTYMEQMGVSVKTLGDNFSSWGDLMVQAYDAFGKATLTGSNIAIEDLDISTEGMNEAMLQSVQDMAKSQIEFLDSQIAMLEGIKALSELESKELSIGSIYDTISKAVKEYNQETGSSIALKDLTFAIAGKTFNMTEEGLKEAQAHFEGVYGETADFFTSFLKSMTNNFGTIMEGGTIEITPNGTVELKLSDDGKGIVSAIEESNNHLTLIQMSLQSILSFLTSGKNPWTSIEGGEAYLKALDMPEGDYNGLLKWGNSLENRFDREIFNQYMKNRYGIKILEDGTIDTSSLVERGANSTITVGDTSYSAIEGIVDKEGKAAIGYATGVVDSKGKMTYAQIPTTKEEQVALLKDAFKDSQVSRDVEELSNYTIKDGVFYDKDGAQVTDESVIKNLETSMSAIEKALAADEYKNNAQLRATYFAMTGQVGEIFKAYGIDYKGIIDPKDEGKEEPFDASKLLASSDGKLGQIEANTAEAKALLAMIAQGKDLGTPEGLQAYLSYLNAPTGVDGKAWDEWTKEQSTFTLKLLASVQRNNKNENWADSVGSQAEIALWEKDGAPVDDQTLKDLWTDLYNANPEQYSWFKEFVTGSVDGGSRQTSAEFATIAGGAASGVNWAALFKDPRFIQAMVNQYGQNKYKKEPDENTDVSEQEPKVDLTNEQREKREKWFNQLSDEDKVNFLDRLEYEVTTDKDGEIIVDFEKLFATEDFEKEFAVELGTLTNKYYDTLTQYRDLSAKKTELDRYKKEDGKWILKATGEEAGAGLSTHLDSLVKVLNLDEKGTSQALKDLENQLENWGQILDIKFNPLAWYNEGATTVVNDAILRSATQVETAMQDVVKMTKNANDFMAAMLKSNLNPQIGNYTVEEAYAIMSAAGKEGDFFKWIQNISDGAANYDSETYQTMVADWNNYLETTDKNNQATQQLSQQIQELENQKNALETEKTNLENQKNALEGEKTELQQSLEDAWKAVNDAQGKVDKLTQDKELLVDTVAKHADNVALANQNLVDAQNAANNARTALEKAQDEKAAAAIKAASLEAAMGAAALKVATAQQQSAEAKAAMEDAEAKMIAAQEKLAEFDSQDNDDVQAAMEAYQQAKANYETKKQEAETAIANYQNLQNELTKAQADAAAAVAAEEAAQASLSDAEQAEQQAQNQLETAKAELATANDALAATQAQLTAANEDLATKKADLATVEKELADVSDALAATEAQLAEKDAQLAAVNEDLATTKTELAAMNEALAAAQKNITDLTSQNNDLRKQNADLQARLNKDKPSPIAIESEDSSSLLPEEYIQAINNFNKWTLYREAKESYEQGDLYGARDKYSQLAGFQEADARLAEIDEQIKAIEEAAEAAAAGSMAAIAAVEVTEAVSGSVAAVAAAEKIAETKKQQRYEEAESLWEVGQNNDDLDSLSQALEIFKELGDFAPEGDQQRPASEIVSQIEGLLTSKAETAYDEEDYILAEKIYRILEDEEKIKEAREELFYQIQGMLDEGTGMAGKGFNYAKTIEESPRTDIPLYKQFISHLDTVLNMDYSDENSEALLKNFISSYSAFQKYIKYIKKNKYEPSKEEETEISKILTDLGITFDGSPWEALKQFYREFEEMETSMPSLDDSLIELSSKIGNSNKGIEALGTASAAAADQLNNISTPSFSITGILPKLQEKSLATGNVSGLALADGNAAVDRLNAGARLAGKTLVGELGPELAVYDGMYHLLGQNGAEFVDLPSNAIVFNHIQTRGIINGQMGFRGRALAEGNAEELIEGSAFANGHITGPARASIDDTLGQLRELRAMWQSILGMTALDLAQAGGGGGGGGGNSLKAVTAELTEWYNLSRQIANLEQEINNLIAERENIAKDNGEAYLRNLRQTQKLLQEQKLTQQILLDYQMKQLERQRDHINNNPIWSKFLTVGEDGLLQYIIGNETNGGKGAINVLSDLQKLSAEEQIKLVKSLGYSYTDTDGKKYEDSELVSKFFEELQEQINQYHELYDTVNGTKETIEGLTSDIEAINDEIIENQKELEQEVYDILVDAWEKEIDALEEQTKLIEEANKAYVDGLKDALSAEKELYEENNSIEERESLQRQLSLLRRSGGSASEIADLEEQLNDTLKEEYFRNQEKMIENIEDANEEQVKKLEEQITLQKEALEYQKENGVLWTEVYKVLAGTKEDILAFMQGKRTEFFSKSALQQEEMLTDWAHKIGIYTEERRQENSIKAATSIWDSNDLWNGETLKDLKDEYDSMSPDQQALLKDIFTSTYVESINSGASESEARLKAEKTVGEHLGRVYKDDGSYEDTGVIGGTSSADTSQSKKLYYGGYTEDGIFVGGAEKFVYGNEALARQFASDPTKNAKVIAVNKAGYFKTSSSPVEPWKKVMYQIVDNNGNPVSNTRFEEEQTAKNALAQATQSAYYAYNAAIRNNESASEIAALKAKWEKYNSAKVKPKLFATGGLVDYTGIAIVHGSKSKPEAFLNAAQTAQIKEALQATNGKENLLSSLHSTVDQLRSLIHNISTINNSTNSNITIAPGAVVINVDQLADSYDVDALSADIMNRMVSIASKATNRGVNRR